MNVNIAARLSILILALGNGLAGCALRSNAGTSPKAPAVHVVLFHPADVPMPSGARERINGIANYADDFFIKEMTQCGYPPMARTLFQRDPSGSVEMIGVRGTLPVAASEYTNATFARDVSARARQLHHVSETNTVWWIFVFLGNRPARFENFYGYGNPRDGGVAVVNYDSLPGHVRPDLALAEGFNGEIFLKGTIHELTHAFGVPHLGPDTNLALGNSLMGPTTAEYKKRNGPHPEKVYLGNATAAMLWKHPIFRGSADNVSTLPSVKLADYKAACDSACDTITISGRVVADQPAHSVVLIDDQGKPRDQYWCRNQAVRLNSDGTFQMRIVQPAHVNGHYRIFFCFDNGLVTGDGRHVEFGNLGGIRKGYNFNNGDFTFTK
jgi:hypothetical protein